MKPTFLLGIITGLVGWIIVLRRQLRLSRQRGDLYRTVAARLDQRLSDREREG